VNIPKTPLVHLRSMRAGAQALVVLGVLLITAGAWAPAPAGATFGGSSNGNVAFISICDSNIGQAVYSVSPVGSPPPTYACPGGTNPYTQSTAGSADSMPSFSSQGTTLYFASNRPGSGNNPGANGNFAIYQVTYPSTVSGSPGSQTDGATQITFPGSSNDYAPTVSADGSELSYIRCNAGTSSCALYVQNPVVGGTPTLVPTSVPPLQPDSVSGAASRPEIDPADSSQILYVGTDNHIHLVSLTSAFAERDLSGESGITAGQVDEYPDWNPGGTNVIFDRSHVVYVLYGINPTTGTASSCQLWPSDPATEIEPIFAPNDTATASSGNCNPSTNQYVWTKLGGGSNIVLDMGHGATNPDTLLTSNRSNNSQPAWQPVAPSTGTPEVPMAALLPGSGVILLAGAFVLERQRRRKIPA
jgi:hypothetical protein